MKKICLFFTTMLLALCLTACVFGKETSIEISELPNSVFEITDENDVENTLAFTLRVLEDGQEQFVLSYPNDKDLIKVSNFDTTKNAGTYTAIVEYDGVRVSFQYKLVSADSGIYDGLKLFTAGTGTVEDPYMITTPSEFLNINKVRNYSEDVNYVLGNDIDFNGVPSENPYYIYWFKGNLDGQGHMIKNLGTAGVEYLFEFLSKGTIQNLDVHSTGRFILSFNNKASSSEPLVLKNVDRYGEYQLIDGNNFGFYFESTGLSYAMGSSSGSNGYGYITFDDCDNYANLYGSAQYAAAYVGFAQWKSNASTVKFINCDNYGIIEGQKVAMFAANGSANYLGNISIENCSNKGEIRGTLNAQLIFATGKDDSSMFDDTAFISGGQATVASSKKISVKNVVKGNLSILNVSGVSVTLGQTGTDKISVTCTNTNVASVVVFGIYYGQSEAGTLMQSVYETFKGFATAEGNTVTASRLFNAQAKGCDAAEIEKLVALGYKFVNESQGNEVTSYEIGDVLYYLHSNNDDYKLNGTASLLWSYVAFDAEGNVIGGGTVK
ncbi:MAG: hypothetical protein ACI32E_02970 [Bacilli bacterium]